MNIKKNIKIILFIKIVIIVGCSSSIEIDLHSYSSDIPLGSLQICNLDNNEYRVKIYRRADNSIAASFRMGEWYDTAESCVQSEILEPGTYYIVIQEKDTNNTDQSKIFYMSLDLNRNFTIDTSGDIGANASDFGNIEVCNSTNINYNITLHNGSTGGFISEFVLNSEECSEFNEIYKGKYYFTAEENSQSVSELFFLDGGAFEQFEINEDGVIGRESI